MKSALPSFCLLPVIAGILLVGCAKPHPDSQPFTLDRGTPPDKEAPDTSQSPPPKPKPASPQPVVKEKPGTPSPVPEVDPDFLGLRWTPDHSTFRVFAPTAQSVTLHLFPTFDAQTSEQHFALEKEEEGIWEVRVPGNLEGKFYAYRLTGPKLNPNNWAVDLYATNTVRSGTRARITDLAKTNPPRWEELKKGPELKSPVDAVIYEMHVRDFTAHPNSGVSQQKGYLGWTESGTRLPSNPTITTALDHLEEIGVTHVHLLPIHDFANDETSDQYNWGYMTNHFFSPEGMYASNIDDDSRIRELKALIAALHERGIGVILDVVYNHTGNQADYNKFAPDYYYRFNPDGSYANGSACGNDFRTESPMGRRLIVDSVKFWAEEYGVDGFRFDLMALMDTGTMRAIERELFDINPNIILYGEPWTSGPTPMQGTPLDKNNLDTTSIGAFNDDFRNALKGFPDGDGPGFIQGVRGFLPGVLQGIRARVPWIPFPAQSINYMTSHDNLVLYDKIELSRPDASQRERIDMMHLGYFLLFTTQGVPFIHGGEEFARTKEGNHNSYNAPDSINRVDWSLKEKHNELYQDVKELIAVRKAHPLFRLRSPRVIGERLKVHRADPEGLELMWKIDGTGLAGESWSRALMVANASDDDVTFDLPEGTWQIGFQSTEPRRHPSLRTNSVRLPPHSGTILYQ